jgi:hypothetical protein
MIITDVECPFPGFPRVDNRKIIILGVRIPLDVPWIEFMPGDLGAKPQGDIRVGKPGEIRFQAEIGNM